MQLCDPLDMIAQELVVLSDVARRHTPAQFLHRKPHTTVLREHEGVEIYPPPSIGGPDFADRGSETVGGLRDKHQLLSLGSSDLQGKTPAIRRGRYGCMDT